MNEYLNYYHEQEEKEEGEYEEVGEAEESLVDLGQFNN